VEPVAGNYYPVNAAAYIKDSKKQYSILNDRSQGGASLNDGQFELMIHRRLLADDDRGVGEPLNETDGITPYPRPVRLGTGLHIIGSHYILIDDPSVALANLRALQSRVFMPFVLGFSPIGSGADEIKKWIDGHVVSGSAVMKDLPPNVDVMTLQSLEGEYLIRLAHQFAVNEDPVLSQPVSVDLSNLFAFLKLSNIKEVSLTANQNANEIKPFMWQVHGENSNENTETFETEPYKDGAPISINPMDIRTFTFNIQKSS